MQQDKALEIMLRGDNVMLTGPAGAGKSYLLERFVAECKKKRRKVVVTATTGLASAHIGGQTIHSWSGIGLDDHLHDDYIYRMSEARKKAIKATKVLIIDEISMMHDYNLNMVDEAMKIVRDNDEPFGGLQVILCGDFFQLPPVSKGGDGNFVVSSRAWRELNLSICYLEEQHRTDDLRLQDILNSLREGKTAQKHLEWLRERMRVPPSGPITRLYTLNVDVERINNEEIARLKGDSHYFLRTSRGKSYHDITNLQRSVLAPETLQLKVEALVMAVKNDPSGDFANGSIGVVKSFSSEGLPVVMFRSGKTVTITPQEWELKKNDRVVAGVTQIPLRLAYAITVHKSQGMTLDTAEIDLSKAFVEGMGYVALSRVRNLENMYLKGLNQKALMVSSTARRIDKELRESSRSLC